MADRVSYAMMMMCIGIVTIAASDIAIKFFAAQLSMWQVLLMRSSVALLLLAPLWRKAYLQHLPTLMLRSAFMGMSYIAFMVALGLLPIATVAGSFFSAPLFVVILSAFWAREHVGPWRWGSVALGFVGVLMVLRPDEFQWSALIAVLAALFYALCQTFTRLHCQHIPAVSLSLWLSVVFWVMGALGMIVMLSLPAPESASFWHREPAWLDATGYVLMVAVGLASVLMHFALASAYQNAPSSLIAPLEYLYLPMIVVGGWLAFGESPDTMTLAGLAVIIVSGLIIAWREQVHWKRARRMSVPGNEA